MPIRSLLEAVEGAPRNTTPSFTSGNVSYDSDGNMVFQYPDYNASGSFPVGGPSSSGAPNLGTSATGPNLGTSAQVPGLNPGFSAARGVGETMATWWSGLSRLQQVQLAAKGAAAVAAAFRASSGGSGGVGGAPSSGLFPDTAAGAIGDQGLLDILLSGGRTDPALLNSQLSGINRSGEAAKDEARGRFAGAGFERSGVEQAVMGALDASTGKARSDAVATENRLAEERKRDDLFRYLQASLQNKGIDSGLFTSSAAIDAQRDAQKDALWAELLNLGINLTDRD